MCLQYILVRFTSSFVLSLPPSSLLRTTLTGFILLFSYTDIKYILHLYPQNPLSLYPPPPRDTQPQRRPILPYYPSFFKACIDSPVGFALVLQACISCLNQINPPPHYLLILRQRGFVVVPFHSSPLGIVQPHFLGNPLVMYFWMPQELVLKDTTWSPLLVSSFLALASSHERHCICHEKHLFQ
jgi:hypothetical protein